MGVWKKQKTFRITRDLMRLLQQEHLLIFQSTLPDPRSRAPVTAIARFQSTLPERGETLPIAPFRATPAVFQSTLPAWGETWPPCIGSPRCHFNPLSPHGERRCALYHLEGDVWISIHSPRMGRDRGRGLLGSTPTAFQSTLPAWGETSKLPLRMASFRFQSTLPAWGET